MEEFKEKLDRLRQDGKTEHFVRVESPNLDADRSDRAAFWHNVDFRVSRTAIMFEKSKVRGALQRGAGVSTCK